MQWRNLEREVRITEPYRRLYVGNVRPENTVLCSLNGTCRSNLPGCLGDLLGGMWFETLVAVTAILSNINIIAVSGVLMTYSQTKAAYEWSSIIALTITSIMMAVLLLTMLWWRRVEAVRVLPRVPETIAVALSYLCTSWVVMDFANMGMETLTAEERDEGIISRGRRYRFGLMLGEDGKERYCVDYDDGVGGDGESEGDSWLKDKFAHQTAVSLNSQGREDGQKVVVEYYATEVPSFPYRGGSTTS